MYYFLLCSYVPWNIHEPHPGQYNFDGDADLLSFIELINETGLLMVLRPGTGFTRIPFWTLRRHTVYSVKTV